MPSPQGSIQGNSDIDIINSALVILGQNTISAFGQNSGTALISQASYNRSRDDLLRKQPWNFARKWVSLSSLNVVFPNLDIIPQESGPGVISFTNAYQIPNDALRIFRFSPKDAHWRIVGKAIYSDAVPATTTATLLGLATPNTNGSSNTPTSSSAGSPVTVGIEYIQQVTSPLLWDASFTDCFVWKLARELSFGITGLMQAYQAAKGEYDDALKDAATLNGIENWPDPYWNTDIIDVRYGYVGVTIEGY